MEVPAVAQMGHVALRPGREIVEYEDLPALGEQELREMGADEARAAGDQGAFLCGVHRAMVVGGSPRGGTNGLNSEYGGGMREKIVRELSPWLALVTCIAVGGAAAAGYGLTSPHRYRATAQLLVAPVKPSDSTFVGIDVLRDTGGKRTAAASVAALLRAPQIVDAVRAQLALKRSSQSLLDAVDAHVVAGSDVVAVTAEDTSPNGAAQLANTFVHALVSQRNAIFQSQLASAIRRDEQLVAGGAGSRVKTRLATLQALLAQPDRP